MKPPPEARMWGGRFSRGPSPLAESFSRSLHFDSRLAPYDILASISQARALRRAGILGAGEHRRLEAALKRLRRTVLSGKADFATGEEDVHTWVENRLREQVGDIADKLHTGRSRNDLVAQDLRLYLSDVCRGGREGLRALREALLDLAEKNVDVIALGHTHFQPAQPVLLAHHLLAYFEMFLRDGRRLEEVLGRSAVLTLGSGALAGTSIPLDREFLRRDLGLASMSENSMDAVSDRDFAVEFLASAALVMTHLSRLCEELVIWSHPSLGWVEIAEDFCTGSSLMPQKRNPDIAELLRGKGARVQGHLTGMLTLLKGLPLTYNRDLQEDKEAIFDGADTLLSCLEVAAAMLRGTAFRRERIEAAARTGFSSATDLAEHLALQGVPFRQAHRIVGELVRHLAEGGGDPADLTLEQLRTFSPRFGEEALGLLLPLQSVKSKNLRGGTAPARVRRALKSARRRNLG